MKQSRSVRNFCIIAHIDHGKSTLADRLLEITGTISKREMTEQVLDKMDLERERGITIKAQAVRMHFVDSKGEEHELNLIDTPGHVDFSYEVSRSLAACEGALLVVDAAQGVEAQTIANAYLAVDGGLEVIPVINKIDLPVARPEEVKKEVEEVLGIDCSDALMVSAKSGLGVEDLLERIVTDIPAPTGDSDGPLRALIFDSHYDAYRGVIAFVRVVDGSIRKGMKIRMFASGEVDVVEEVGMMTASPNPLPSLNAGEVGYVVTGIKDVSRIKVGDTITDFQAAVDQPLPGYREIKPMVFAGLYPLEGGDYTDLRDSLEKLELNDPAFVWEPETSKALGFGFRCGFLGLLHMDIIRERLEREYKLELLVTTPSVAYRVNKENGDSMIVSNPADMPPAGDIESVEEPTVAATIIVPTEYVGAMFELCTERRGVHVEMRYLSEARVELRYVLPLAEILVDFFDQLKSRSRGYASFDYDVSGYQVADLSRLDILLSGDIVDALSMIVPRANAFNVGKSLTSKLRDIIPRQQFEVAIQAAIGGRIIARESVKAQRKDVTARCYGGDISRKRKLLERQKEGKKKMKRLGKVEIPQEAFMTILKVDDSK